jgi:hypothetical protein
MYALVQPWSKHAMADDTTPKIENVHQVLKQAVADLLAAGVEPPAALLLAAILAARHAIDDRSKP